MMRALIQQGFLPHRRSVKADCQVRRLAGGFAIGIHQWRQCALDGRERQQMSEYKRVFEIVWNWNNFRIAMEAAHEAARLERLLKGGAR